MKEEVIVITIETFSIILLLSILVYLLKKISNLNNIIKYKDNNY